MTKAEFLLKCIEAAYRSDPTKLEELSWDLQHGEVDAQPYEIAELEEAFDRCEKMGFDRADLG